jgi:hemolysin activation/secretion protein
LAAAARFALKQIRFQGNHVFSSRALHHLVAGLEGREVTFDDLEGARQAVTLHYVNAGYINSGAVIEDQGVAGGIITIKVVEGQLTKIEVSGNWWFRSWWLRGEVRRFAGQPLNERRLREGLQLLRQLPGILQVNSELMPGSKPGEAILDLSVKERQPFRLALDYTNARPPSVGSQAVTLQAADLNLTGHNDPLIVSWGLLRGKDADFAYSGADNLAGSYTFPITPWGTTVEVRASRNDSSILEEAFRALDITSETTEYGGTLRQPLFQSLAWDIGLSGGFARKMNDSFLLQRPFSLSPGAIDGSTEVDVLSAGFDVSNRSTKHVFSLRAAFNWGLDAFDATIHDGAAVSGARSVPDGRFFSWVGQAQYVRRLNENGLLAIARVNAQLSDGPLLSLEQFPIGGVNSVRGYRENTLLRDNGVFGSLELRYPIWQIGKDELRRPILTLVPFVDLGTGWRSARGGEASASDDRETLASVGLGFVFEPVSRVRAQLFWGRALNRDFVIRENQTLQDYGLHFSITVSAF